MLNYIKITYLLMQKERSIMKKIILLLSISLFLTCINITDKNEAKAISNNYSHHQNSSYNKEMKNLDEYPILNKHFPVNSYKTQLIVDNPYKRIILFKDNKGHVKFKSIYIKNTDRLKIINMHKGLIYNGIIK